MLVDADNVILLAQHLRNIHFHMPVCGFTIGFLGQGRGQRSWNAKLLNILIFFVSATNPKNINSLQFVGFVVCVEYGYYIAIYVQLIRY